MNTRDEEQYVVLEVRPTGPTRRGRSAGDAAVAATLSVESFSTRDAVAARRDPAVAVAPLLPMKLVEPVAALDAGAPSGPGSAWGVEAVGAVESPFTGVGVTVAVLDTGIDASHEVFAGLTIIGRLASAITGRQRPASQSSSSRAVRSPVSYRSVCG